MIGDFISKNLKRRQERKSGWVAACFIVALLAVILLHDSPTRAASLPSTCQGGGGYCANLAQISASGLAQIGPATQTNVRDNLGDFLARLYTVGIAVVALAAFVVFTIGGVLYLTAGDNENRVTNAKNYMENAVSGLTIALLSWLILYIINPDLVQKLSVIGLKRLELPVQSRSQPSQSQPSTSSAWFCPVLGSALTFNSQTICNIICDPTGIGFLFTDRFTCQQSTQPQTPPTTGTGDCNSLPASQRSCTGQQTPSCTCSSGQPICSTSQRIWVCP